MAAQDNLPPVSQGPQGNDFWTEYLNYYSSETGMESRTEYAFGGRTVSDLLNDKTTWSGAGKKFNSGDLSSVTKALKNAGIDLDKSYGRDGAEVQRIQERIRRVIGSLDSKDGRGRSASAKQEEELRKIAKDIQTFGETSNEVVTERMAGLAGVSSASKAKKLDEWMRKNPNKNVGTLKPKDLAKIFGVDEKEITKDQMADLKDFASADDFQNYRDANEIARQSMQIAKDANKQYQAMLDKVKQPGYARSLADQVFAPQETEFKQFFEPTEGATISEAGKIIGEQEAAMGRTGSTKAAEELNRQKIMAKERIESQKTAYAGQIQQHIDLQQPGEVLRMGQQSGQMYPYYSNVYASQMLQPYQQMFPLMQQQQQMQLAPYSFAQQPQSEPGWLDYAMTGLQAGAQIAGPLLGRPS